MGGFVSKEKEGLKATLRDGKHFKMIENDPNKMMLQQKHWKLFRIFTKIEKGTISGPCYNGTVWPDSRIKSNPISTIVAQRVATAILLEKMLFKIAQTVFQIFGLHF